MALLRTVASRAAAIKSCATARASDIKPCATARASDVKTCAAGHLAKINARADSNGSRVKLWIREYNLACQKRKLHTKEMKELDSMFYFLERREYEVQLLEYRKFRTLQNDFKLRDIYKRMQKLGMISKDKPFPLPLPEGEIGEITEVLPPIKPSWVNFQTTLKVASAFNDVFDKTVNVVINLIGGR